MFTLSSAGFQRFLEPINEDGLISLCIQAERAQFRLQLYHFHFRGVHFEEMETNTYLKRSS